MSPGIVAESDLSGNLTSEYVFFDGERVARKDFPGNTVSYYFSDHLKTASVITDSAGTIKSDSDFYPWGGELQFLNNDLNHYKFGGHERDNETGLDYMLARYYSNPLGRFLTPDWSSIPVPVPYADLTNPQTLNQYAYVHNNPMSFGDPDGHIDWPSWSDVGDFIRGVANAYGSDNLAGVGRNDEGGTAYHAGQIIGDGTALIQGAAETLVGGAGEVASTAADATGVGAIVGVPGNIASAGLIIHGSTTFVVAGQHLLKGDASKSSGSKGEDFTPSAKKEIDARDGNQCQNCGQDVRSVQNKRGQPTPADQRQRHHIKPKSEGGKGTPSNGKTLCPACHKEEHRKMREAKKKEQGS
jgi:RHS repeat-associated protein